VVRNIQKGDGGGTGESGKSPKQSVLPLPLLTKQVENAATEQ